MEFLTNEWLVMAAGWAMFIMNELIEKSKLKSNGITSLVMNIFKYLTEKK